MQLVVDVFVRARRGELGKKGVVSTDSKVRAVAEEGTFSKRLQAMIERIMDSMVDHENQRTLRDEAQVVFKESIDHIRAKLGKAGFENEEIAARATKLLAEAEATKATAAKTRAEADEIVLRTLAKKLDMVLEAEKAVARGEMEGFLKVLKELGKA
jgi:regulator of protease activity HflC (stomatin/prohibitin superfamily)